MINLPRGGVFYAELLINHLREEGRNFIIQGQQACSLVDHTKPRSLDYWLRTNGALNQDTKHAENRVLDLLVDTGLFAIEEDLVCPDSGARCKGIRLL